MLRAWAWWSCRSKEDAATPFCSASTPVPPSLQAYPLEVSLTLLGDWQKAQLYSSWMAAAASHVDAARIPNHHFLQVGLALSSVPLVMSNLKRVAS